MAWSTIAPFTPGRCIILVGNLFYSIGAFAADFNETHVYNPRWPPHAKFHNGQTMTLGTLLAVSSTYFAWRATKSQEAARDSLWTAAVIGTMYCLAGLSAILYPGTDWYDPESGWGEDKPTQKPIFALTCAAMWVGYWVDVLRMPKSKSA